MPKAHLCETDDQAYNLGRLLCVMAGLQDEAHDNKLEGPGIVEKYYGAASSSPAWVFTVLWKLHIHHLRKLEQGDKGLKAAFAIRERIAVISSRFPCCKPGGPPEFPQQLSLVEQGRFALGYYQQLAYESRARQVMSNLRKCRDTKKSKPDEAKAFYEVAKQQAESSGYEDLILNVRQFELTNPE
jgi:CRISPR-associated protein Csd1